MLLVSIGIGFLLLFGVLISDGMSSGSAGATDASSRTRKTTGEAAPLPETRTVTNGPRTIGARRPDDGIDLAA